MTSKNLSNNSKVDSPSPETKLKIDKKEVTTKIIPAIEEKDQKLEKLEKFLMVSYMLDQDVIKPNNIKTKDEIEIPKEGELVLKDKLNLLIKDLDKDQIKRNEVYLIQGKDFVKKTEKPPKKKKKVILSLVEKLKHLKISNQEEVYERKDIDTVYDKYNKMMTKTTPTPMDYQDEDEPKKVHGADCLIF